MKNFLKIVTTLLLVLVAIAVAMQGMTAIYNFPTRTAFFGKHIYNPYKTVDSAQFGSSFMAMDCSAMFVHRFNFTGFQTQCFGATAPVIWFDYLLMPLKDHQTQYFMATAAGRLPLVGVGSPAKLCNGVDSSIFETLTSYDVMAVDRAGAVAWDVGLSNGHYSTLSCGGEGRLMVGGGSLSSMRAGESYMIKNGDEPHINGVTVNHDTVVIKLNVKADSILLFGHRGAVRHGVKRSDTLVYIFQDGDSYVRAEIHLPGQITVWLNPIARTENKDALPAKIPTPPVNMPLTILNSLGWGVAALLILWLIIPLWRRGKRPKNRSGRHRNLYAPLQYVRQRYS